MKVNVPQKIKIGAYDYRVVYTPDLVYDYKLLGQSLADKQLIKIEPNTTQQTNDVTLGHEIIHAISEIYNCDLDEKNIDRLAQGWIAVLRDSFGIEFDWSEIKENK